MIKTIIYVSIVLLLFASGRASASSSFTSQVEADWLRQAEAWVIQSKPVQTFEDARGAVDGIKNGLYGFHVGQEPNPWWQVDLGTERPVVSLIKVYNRLDYAPGL